MFHGERADGLQPRFQLEEQMQRFAVRVRPMGSHYLVSVEGFKNANWLLTQLSRNFIFRNAEPITQERDSPDCTFHVPYDGRLPVHHFRRVLNAIPEVRLAPEVQVTTVQQS